MNCRPLLVLACAALVAGCSSGGSPTGTPTSLTAGSSAPVGSTVGSSGVTSTSAAATGGPSLLGAWCRVRIGQSEQSVLAAMGPPKGHVFDSYKRGLAPGLRALEWDDGRDVFLATFEHARVVRLQASSTNHGATACPIVPHP